MTSHDSPQTTLDLDYGESGRLPRSHQSKHNREFESPRMQEPAIDHWYDPVPSSFTTKERSYVTLLTSGLTLAHDKFLSAGLRGFGYKVQILDCPDNKALNIGKEFGNRGQCNPTYFTVGNLIKYLSQLRDEDDIPVEDIIKNYVFLTSGSCGPCRFGMYATEYRKALRDAGFEGFRVLLFQQSSVDQSTGEDSGLKFDFKFFVNFAKCAMAGDILNVLGYRIRPYELEPGTTDAALEKCQQYVCEALAKRKSVLPALWRCRKVLKQICVDRTQPKPRVSLIGEFWAMTTEGDGNYKLQRFLESEGAEVDIQLLSSWLLYLIWEVDYDTRLRQSLKGVDGGRYGLRGVSVGKRRFLLWLAEKSIRLTFSVFSRTVGMQEYRLPDMRELADLSHEYYDNHLRGGEGHLEVAKVMLNVIHNKVNMTISVKPFGCMPSSGVSDGVQSLIVERYPRTIFLPIETTGDGAVSVYSRVQMQLFKARRVVQQETESAYTEYGVDEKDIEAFIMRNPEYQMALHRSPQQAGSTNVDLIHEIGRKIGKR